MRHNRLRLAALIAAMTTAPAAADAVKARQVIAAAVEAMGGKHYLEVRNSHSSGNYFMFDREGRKGFSRYLDWTNLKPIKWRFQLGQGKNQSIDVYNLELGKGWKLEGKEFLEDAKPEDIEEFRKSAKRDLDLLLRHRVDEPDMSLFYYGPDEVAGTGEFEAVEFLDSSNLSVTVFFNRQSHLPTKLESQIVDKFGIKHKEEVEFFTWHSIQDVLTPLRVDVSVDGQVTQQRFVEKLAYNVDIPEDYFLEPKVEKKK
jgi:hypothetical protein